MKKTDAINKCQYWSTHEPLQCIYWDNDSTVCTYKFQPSESTEEFDEDTEDFESSGEETTKNLNAEFAPYCNLLGTLVSCTQYESPNPGEIQPRCVLPDPRRHVCNRETGEKWVLPLTTISGESDEGYALQDWYFEAINGYNNGACDDNGTNTTCSGYAPYHLGFGVLQPSKEEDKYDTFKENRFSITKEFGYRLPTNFVIYNIRARLSRCYWWKVAPGEFTVNEVTGQVELSDVWACSSTKDTSKYSEFTLEHGPPCNGCKPECPYYTGICWQYCIDEKMETGDPILAEQIHELRYYHRENMWTTDAMESLFIDNGTIFTWHGIKTTGVCEDDEEDCVPSNSSLLKGNVSVVLDDDGNILEYQIPSIRTHMPDFEKFEVETKHENLTQGTTITKKLKDYPTLIREIQQLPLSPIIKNRYSHDPNDEQENRTNYFETTNLKGDQNILIYGKMFFNQTIKAINLSDKELRGVLPEELYYFDSIYDIEEYYSSADPVLGYSSERFYEFQTNLEATLYSLEKLMPHKIGSSSVPTEDLTFIIETPTVNKKQSFDDTSDNTIMVWQIVGEYITFSKTTFTKRIVGGALLQRTFSLESDKLAVDGPKDYEKDFNAFKNNNGTIEFDFVPFVTGNIACDPLHFYNDSILNNPLTTDTYKGHHRYKITAEEFLLDDDEFVIISESGYMLINIDHPFLNSVFKPWEVDEVIVKYEVDNPVAGEEGEEETITIECEMEVLHHGADKLIGPQQLIVKPKDPQNLSAACNVWITLKNLTFWDKRSFGDSVPEMDFFEIEADDGDAIISLDVGSASVNSDSVTLTDFGFAMTPSIVIANCEGKPFTQYRTKAIGQVNQPSCPDVEIFYMWKAEYTDYQNKPICRCCGRWSQIHPSPATRSYVPFCGDHFLSRNATKGPMWWPYNRCLEWVTYDQLTNLNNFSLDVIGLYQVKVTDDATGETSWLHGSHDMRMQGPHDFYGYVGIGCNPLLPCSCNMRSYNTVKEGDNIFTGYAKIRGGVSTSQIQLWQEYGSAMPKFGNAIRPLVRNYRTLDVIPYANAKNTEVLWKLMPASMMFSRADITATDDEMWSWYCSGEGPNVVNPLGFYLAQDFNHVKINETIDKDNRFRHDEIFRCKWTVDIAYQKTAGEYSQRRGDTPIIPWYEFKQHPTGGGNFIQWAWQENWKDIERNYRESSADLLEFIQAYIEGDEVSNIKGTFVDSGDGLLKGMFLTLEINYPEYRYDYKNKEYRQVIDEDLHAINFIAPKKDESTGEYSGYPAFSLDGGPKRGISWSGEWLTKENATGQLSGEEGLDDYNIDLYKKCIGDETKTRSLEGTTTVEKIWSEDVTLFGKGYENESTQIAEDDERMVQTYYEDWPKIITLKTHFQRGLNVELNPGVLGKLPLQVAPVDQIEYFGTDNGIFSITCNRDPKTAGYAFENIKRTIGRFTITYTSGTKTLVEGTDEQPPLYSYHHFPQITIFSSDDGKTPIKEIFRTEAMYIYDGKDGEMEVLSETFEWENDWDYIGNGHSGLIIEYRVTPTEQELQALDADIRERYESNLNLVELIYSNVFEETLVNAVEDVNVYERKYIVSYGSSGDCPPQGKDDDDSKRVLGKRKGNDRSYVWQVDEGGQVKDVPNSDGPMKFMNKVRGRIVGDVYEDETAITTDFMDIEGTQKELYDEAVNWVDPTSTMRGLVPSPIREVLDDAGVTFAGPSNLTLNNDTVQPLAELNAFPQMSANGHRYQPGAPKKEICYPGSGDDPCVDGGGGGDSFKFKYTNMDYLLGPDILVNAVLYSSDPETGNLEIDIDGDKLTSSENFAVDTETQYGTTGDWRFGNPFDTVMTNPITQLYAGRAWQVDRTMMYEALMDTVFPKKFNRTPSPNIYAEPTSEYSFGSLGMLSYGGIIDNDYVPSQGYSRQPANSHWTDPHLFWPGFSGLFSF